MKRPFLTLTVILAFLVFIVGTMPACEGPPPTLVHLSTARHLPTATRVRASITPSATMLAPTPAITISPMPFLTRSPTGSPSATSSHTPIPAAAASSTPSLSPVPTHTTVPPASTVSATLETSDGTILAAVLYVPEGTGPFAGVLLSHMGGSSKEGWGAVPVTLQRAGFASLAFDFRGHGESGGLRDPSRAAADLTAALAFLRSQPQVAHDQIGLVGASMGGMASVIQAASDPGVRTVIAISTSPGAAGQQPIKYIEQLSPRPFLAIGCDQDPLTHPERVEQLFEAAGQPKRLIILACDAHANDILSSTASVDLTEWLLKWLKSHLRNPP